MSKNFTRINMATKNWKAIGIVGGMGPAAGFDLAYKITTQTIAVKDQDHIPVILYSFPGEITDRTEYILGKTKVNPGSNIAMAIIEMYKAGATVAGIACNSAHIPKIYDEVTTVLQKNNITINLLNMINEISKFIKSNFPKHSKIGVLGTTGTYITKLFNSIEDHGYSIINLNETEQEALHSAIYHSTYGLKSTGTYISKQAKKIIMKSCGILAKKKAGLILFGCTELPVAYTKQDFQGIPVLDTNLIFARALINAFAPEKLKPYIC